MKNGDLNPAGTPKSPESPISAKGPAELAPESIQDRRSRPARDSLNPGGSSAILIAVLVAEWIIFGIWALAPVVSEWHRYVQPLVWIPDWLWFIGLLPLALVGIILGIQSRRTGFLVARFGMAAAVLPVIVLGGGVIRREWKPWATTDSAPSGRIVFLNALMQTREDADGVIDTIESMDPDLVVIVNPGWIAPVWRERVGAGIGTFPGVESPSTGEPWSIRWVSPILVAAREKSVALRTIIRSGGIKAVRIDLPDSLSSSLGASRLVVVDLPSEWRRSRGRIIEELGAAIQSDIDQQGEGVDLILGDFNLTPRTPALTHLLPGMRDLFVSGGSGWGATWPRENPLIRIDFALGGSSLGSTSIRTFDPGIGGHRGLVLDIRHDSKAEASR
jgi:hypothetical protein